MEAAYQLAYSRKPDAAELQTALGFLERQRGIIAAREGAALALPTPAPEPMRPPRSRSARGSVSHADELQRVCVSELGGENDEFRSYE